MGDSQIPLQNVPQFLEKALILPNTLPCPLCPPRCRQEARFPNLAKLPIYFLSSFKGKCVSPVPKILHTFRLRVNCANQELLLTYQGSDKILFSLLFISDARVRTSNPRRGATSQFRFANGHAAIKSSEIGRAVAIQPVTLSVKGE